MKAIARIALLAVLALTPLAPLDAGPAQAQSAETRLNRGEVVVTIKGKHPIYDIDVSGLVDGTTDQVWDAITTYDRYEDFLPLVTESAVRKRSGNVVQQYVKMTPPWPFHMQWMINECHEEKAAGRLWWRKLDGNVKHEEGYWLVSPHSEGRTKLVYHLQVDPWMDVVPGWVFSLVTRSVMPDIIKGVRKRVKAARGQ